MGMSDIYSQADDYEIAVTYLAAALSGDDELAKNVATAVEPEVLENGFMLLGTLLFLELQKTYPELTFEQYTEKVRRRDFSQ